jgi:hypothetical protein
VKNNGAAMQKYKQTQKSGKKYVFHGVISHLSILVKLLTFPKESKNKISIHFPLCGLPTMNLVDQKQFGMINLKKVHFNLILKILEHIKIKAEK